MPHYRLHRDPKSSHQQIAALVGSLGGPVLDVGAAQGFLGQMLQGSGVALDAVEMNPEWARLCEPFYRRVYAGRAEDVTIEGGEKYRTIVCADVLEHTPDPVSILRKLRELATPDATFIVSLPNVAHLAVRLMLLFGRFPKMDRGILDRTHLQFLTRDTATQMLGQAGLRVRSVSSTGVPLDEVWKGGEGKALYRLATAAQRATVKVMPRLFAMQWVFVAKAVPEAAGGIIDLRTGLPVDRVAALTGS